MVTEHLDCAFLEGRGGRPNQIRNDLMRFFSQLCRKIIFRCLLV